MLVVKKILKRVQTLKLTKDTKLIKEIRKD